MYAEGNSFSTKLMAFLPQIIWKKKQQSKIGWNWWKKFKTTGTNQSLFFALLCSQKKCGRWASDYDFEKIHFDNYNEIQEV